MNIRLLIFCGASLAAAQHYAISTVAGVGTYPFAGEGQPAPNVVLFSPNRVAVDKSGTVYFSETYYQRVFKVTPQGTLVTVAGTGSPGLSGDGGQAIAAQLSGPTGLAVDSVGNLYIADTTNSRIRKVTPNGIITTVAGTSYGFSGDGGPASSAKFTDPADIKFDAAGNMYIADTGNHRIRKITTDGMISTVGGTGEPGFSGDGGSATAAELQSPSGLALDTTGNIYVSDTGNYRVRKISIAGIVSTVAGTGVTGFSGDGSPATLAQISSPHALAFDASGDLLIADTITGKLRKVTAGGLISTIAGNGPSTLNGGDGALSQASSLILPGGVAVDSLGNIFLAESEGRRVRRIDATTGVISRVGGVDPNAASLGDGGPPLQASLYNPAGVALDLQGNLLISDSWDLRIRKISAGVITTIAGDGVLGAGGNGGPALAASLDNPSGLVADAGGNIFFNQGYEIRKIAATGIVSQIAGTGQEGYSGDNGPASAAKLFEAQQIALDKNGNVYIPDSGNNRLRMVTPGGQIVTIAGTGTAGFSGDGGPATEAKLFHPSGVAVDPLGNVFLSDSGNNRIRKIALDGTITTIAGTGVQGASGDGGPATQALLSDPTTLAFGPDGNLYICLPARIREINSAGTITTVAGTGTDGYSGDGDSALNALMDGPSGLAFDSSGSIYFVDSGNQVVRKLEPVQFFSSSVVNAASLTAGPVAPGEIITIFGTSIGPGQFAFPAFDPSGAFSNKIGSTQVMFDGTPAPMIFASANQVSAIVPYAVAGKTRTNVQIQYQGQPTNTVVLNVAPSAPALFTASSSGAGQAAALNQDSSVNSVSKPAAPGSVIVLFGTGEGQTNPSGQDGVVASTVYPTPVQPVSVKIGGKPAQVLYAGAAPGEVAGLLQINAQIPSGVIGDAVPVQVTVGTASSPSQVTIVVR